MFETLATEHDLILATGTCPPMKLNKGLKIGSKGGHGTIKYLITNYQSDTSITFQFDIKNFNGIYKFEIKETE